MQKKKNTNIILRLAFDYATHKDKKEFILTREDVETLLEEQIELSEKQVT